MSDDLKDLVNKCDGPVMMGGNKGMMTKKEMEKTQVNQHMQSKTITPKKTKNKKKK